MISDDGDHTNIATPDYNKTAFDKLLRGIKTAGFNIGTFLAVLLRSPKPQTQQGNSQTHIQMVSAFLRGSQKVKAQDIAELMYSQITAPLMHLVKNNNASTRTKPAVLSEYLELVGPKGLRQEGNDLVLAFPGLFPEIMARLCSSS
jgi:hypothetical protein